MRMLAALLGHGELTVCLMPQTVDEDGASLLGLGELTVHLLPQAVDEDAAENAAVLYSVPESSPFSIDPTSGEIRTRRPLDYENQGVSSTFVVERL